MARQVEIFKDQLENAVVFALAPTPDPLLIDRVNNWRAVVEFMVNSKLAGIFFRKLQSSHLLQLIPETEAERLRQFYYFTALKNKVLLSELARIQGVLTGRDVPLVVLKGASLLLTRVCQMGERYQADLDFLVKDMERQDLRKLLEVEGYIPVEHSDRSWWSEEHFIKRGSQFGDDVFTVFLEFHWTFRPLNRGQGQELARSIFESARSVKYAGQSYQVPSLSLQFYQAAIHGSAYHPFDSAYFWVSLSDLSALAREAFDPQPVIELAEKHRMLEHLGVMSWILSSNLGLASGLWEAVAQKTPGLKPVMEETGQALWHGLLNPAPISFANLIYLFSRASFASKLHAFWELSGMARGERVEVMGKSIKARRTGFFRLFASRLRKLNREFLRMVWQMARFYRSIGFFIPDDK